MTLSSSLSERSSMQCELCSNTEALDAFIVPPKTDDAPENQVVVCSTCLNQINEDQSLNPDHWRCLNESIWSEVPAVKVVAFRMLRRLSDHDWAADLKGMMYMEEDTLEWAEQEAASALIHKDSNGNILEAGDTVTLIQDLNVKGASFTAKRGTAVRRIRLVHDNAEHIEGKIDGQHIVILTKFVKKSS